LDSGEGGFFKCLFSVYCLTKQVQYILQIVSPEAMAAAVEAADELTKSASRSKNVLTSRFQSGKVKSGSVGVTITPIAR